MNKPLPRGIRNNNPGNIEHQPTNAWQGLCPDKPSDSRFCRFTDPKWGIRALARVLLKYQSAHGLKTVDQIINRWAPPTENRTDVYVDKVAAHVGVSPHDEIDVSDSQVMRKLLESITLHENGIQPYTEAEFIEGMKLAGIDAKTESKPLVKSRTMQGAAIAGTGGILGLLLENGDTLTMILGFVAPGIAPMLPQILTVAGAAYAAYARWDDSRSGKK